MPTNPIPPDLDTIWDFNDPATSEDRFRDLLITTPTLHAEILTQIARAQGLQRHFPAALATLDEAAALLPHATPRAHIRHALERGRVHNSSGHPTDAIPHFTAAWDLARASGEDALAIDAAHMLAIAEPPDRQLPWHERAVALAQSSPDPKATAWFGSLAHNLGWTLHDLGRPAAALPIFEQALSWREAKSDPGPTRIARWTVARCLRTLGRTEEALSLQQSLRAALDATGDTDPYVDEEIGECLLALNRQPEATPTSPAPTPPSPRIPGSSQTNPPASPGCFPLRHRSRPRILIRRIPSAPVAFRAGLPIPTQPAP